MARSPLFDIYDPQGILQQQAAMGLLPEDDEEIYGAFPVRRKPRISDLMPQEEQSGLLNTLAQAGSSGLAAAGYILDTPGALVRGLLAGDPLSVFGTSEDRVTGRELLRQYGAIGEEDTWGNFGGGLAAEVLLDPLTYGTLGISTLFGQGAKTAAGKAAQASGLLRNAALDAADTPGVTGVRNFLRNATPNQQLARIADPVARAEAARTLQRQLQRFGAGPTGADDVMGAFDDVRLPFTNIGFSYNLGPVGDRVANFADQAGEFTRTAPVIGQATRLAAAAFDKRAGEYWNPDLELTNLVQDANRRAARNTDDLMYADRLRQSSLQREALGATAPEVFPAQAGALSGQAIPEDLRSFRNFRLQQAMADFAEGGGATPTGQYGPALPSGAFYSGARGSGDEMADWVMQNVPEFRAVRDEFANLGRNANVAADAAGLPITPWNSQQGTDWFPRQLAFFRQDRPPVRPGAAVRREKPWARAERILGTQDNFGRRRQAAYDIPGGMRTFRQLTGNIDPRLDSAALQQSLIGVDDTQVRGVLDAALNQIGIADPYQPWIDDVLNSPEYLNAAPAAQQRMLQDANATVDGMYVQLADLLRSADTQFAATGRGIFDSNPWNNMSRYRAGQVKNQANAQELVRQMQQLAEQTPANQVVGGTSIPLAQAAQQFGFDPAAFRRLWQNVQGADPTNFSINERYVDALRTLAPKTQLAMPERGMLGAVDQFTNMFKVGALANPAFHTRNLYSGAVNAATHNAFNPLDMYAAARASAGNFDALARRLKNAPGFENMTAAERIARYQDLTGATQVAGSNVLDDVAGMPEQSMRGMSLGSDPTSVLQQTRNAAYQPGRSWRQFLSDMTSMRGVGFTQNPMRENTNPLLALNDAVGGRVEDSLRGGSFLTQLRQGVDPRRAADVSFLSNVDYRPEAFTGFEKGLKRILPFYSYQKGILPSIGTNLVERPGGLQSQLIRSVTRGTEPSEDNFVPEYLRQSAAIPLPADMPSIFGGSGNPDLKRYLTNLDLPWESTFQMYTPGVGTGFSTQLADSIRKSGSNLLGTTNPLIKAPIEYITNRQLYSGRELSDLYSVLEQDLGPLGRPLEQAVTNFFPFGSRALGLYRQATDDRLTTGEAAQKAAFNLLAGMKLTDVDQDRAKRLAARDMLNSLLETTPGVRTFENIAVPADVLAAMPQEQQQMYLLYKIIQSEAAKKARDRKKQTAMDPLELLGAVTSPQTARAF
jgi:hypothetical protein